MAFAHNLVLPKLVLTPVIDDQIRSITKILKNKGRVDLRDMFGMLKDQFIREVLEGPDMKNPPDPGWADTFESLLQMGFKELV